MIKKPVMPARGQLSIKIIGYLNQATHPGYFKKNIVTTYNHWSNK